MSTESKAIDAVLMGDTGTGLDDLVRYIVEDPGLNHRVPKGEIAEAAQSADGMNHLIIDAILKAGLANDGVLNAADVRDLSDHIKDKHYGEWVRLHGDDERWEETGFHLVQNDGAVAHLFGSYNAINTVADGVYHLGFGIERDRLLNEDGNRNASVKSVAHWLDQLLKEELTSGMLANPEVDPYVEGTTGTGLDKLTGIIVKDPGLNCKVSTSEINEAAGYADQMNAIIIEAVKATGVGYNGKINAADVRDLNEHIREHHYDKWVTLHGDDEGGKEYGFHLVQNDGATTHLFDGRNAVNTVADGLYHLGFEIERDRLLNEDGNRNASVQSVAHWLDVLLDEDLEKGTLIDKSVLSPYMEGTTDTGLDELVKIIVKDPGLNRKVSTSEINEAAGYADQMNAIIIEAIKATGVGYNGKINAADVRELNEHIREHHYDKWVELHGDDEGGKEYGFHLVQNDGATTHLFDGRNAVNTVADGLYHLGFAIRCDRLLNEDGNKNASVESAAHWLDALLYEDLKSGELIDPKVADPYFKPTTGTGLDALVKIITGDLGLNRKVSTGEINEAARNADAMNKVIIEAIKATGAGNNGHISQIDMRDMNAHIQEKYEEAWIVWHGDDEKYEETGFHLVQNDGSTSYLFGKDAVDTVADGIYHMGFDIKHGRFLNEDGNRNVSVETAAGWLNKLLAEELADGDLHNPDFDPVDPDPDSVVFALTEPVEVDGRGDEVEIAHQPVFELPNGAITLTFRPDSPGGSDRDTLFSKDAKYYGDGGHLTAWVSRDDLTLRFQSEKESLYLEARDVIEAGEEYDLAFSFGENGAHLYLNGEKVDNAPEFKVDLTQNTGSLVIGANTWARTEKNPDWRADYFDGWIDDFIIFDHALSPQEVAGIRDSGPNPGPDNDGSGVLEMALKFAQDSLDSYSIL